MSAEQQHVRRSHLHNTPPSWWLRLGLGRSGGLFGEEAVAIDYGGGEVDEFAVVDS